VPLSTRFKPKRSEDIRKLTKAARVLRNLPRGPNTGRRMKDVGGVLKNVFFVFNVSSLEKIVFLAAPETCFFIPKTFFVFLDKEHSEISRAKRGYDEESANRHEDRRAQRSHTRSQRSTSPGCIDGRMQLLSLHVNLGEERRGRNQRRSSFIWNRRGRDAKKVPRLRRREPCLFVKLRFTRAPSNRRFCCPVPLRCGSSMGR